MLKIATFTPQEAVDHQVDSAQAHRLSNALFGLEGKVIDCVVGRNGIGLGLFGIVSSGEVLMLTNSKGGCVLIVLGADDALPGLGVLQEARILGQQAAGRGNGAATGLAGDRGGRIHRGGRVETGRVGARVANRREAEDDRIGGLGLSERTERDRRRGGACQAPGKTNVSHCIMSPDGVLLPGASGPVDSF